VIEPDKVRGMLHNLGRFVGYLHTLAALSPEELAADFSRSGSVRYYLQVAIECCLDMANHIIATESLRSPRDYADAFVVLGEAGIVPAEFVPTLQQMARLRNRLVHLYWEVDDAVLHQILTDHLDDFDRFKSHVLVRLAPPGTLHPPGEET